MQRRHFIRRAAIGLAAFAGTLLALSWIRQFFPRLAGEKRRISLGDPLRFPVDTYTYLEEHNFFVYRDHEGLRVVSAICTHLGCTLNDTTEGFECPCHGSCYNRDGEVLSGPAPRNLDWYQVSGNSEGKIVVDPGVKVGPEDKYLQA